MQKVREILFRGISVQTGKFVYGDFSSSSNICFYDFEDGKDVIDDNEVLRDTVGQFTGLTDKNGEKIFEGDIVCNRKFEYEVYIEGGSLWGFNRLTDTRKPLSNCCAGKMVVVGNIFGVEEAGEVETVR